MDVSWEGGLGQLSLADGIVVLRVLGTVQILFPVEQAVEPKDDGQGARELSLVWLSVGIAWLCSFFPFSCSYVFSCVSLFLVECSSYGGCTGTGLMSEHPETAIEVSVCVES